MNNFKINEGHDVPSNINNIEVCHIENNIPQPTMSEEANASSDNTNYTTNNSSMQKIDTILAKLSVDYDDSVLSTNSPELELVNSYFESISCGDKGIQTLLYEVIGYSLTKTAKLNKSFIFKGNGRNGKSKIFRILEALLGEQLCSHEHLEQLSGSKSGSKSTIKQLERVYSKYCGGPEAT